MAIRHATAADAGSIAALHAESWRRTYRGNFRDEFLDADVVPEREATWRERLGQPVDGQCVLVAIHDGALVGFVCAFGGHDPRWGSHIDNLHVAPGAHGQGIGRQLMAAVAAWLAEHHGELGVFLYVWESNDAKVFYERLGGRSAERVEVENPGGGVGVYDRMVWERPDAIG